MAEGALEEARALKAPKPGSIRWCQLYQQHINTFWCDYTVAHEKTIKRERALTHDTQVALTTCCGGTEASHCIRGDLLTTQAIPQRWRTDCWQPGLEELRGYGISEGTKILGMG